MRAWWSFCSLVQSKAGSGRFRWAKLVVDMKKKGQTLPLLDGMIAATALRHGLIVATHNVRHFKRTGAKVVDPFA